jgi:O-acetyl-ADP-ribose deacetylase (regulator of RNase III)
MMRSWQSKFGTSRLTVEVWDTTCVVTNMPEEFHILINPANPQLSGVSKFVYFPVGGPQPPPNFQINKDAHPIMGYVSQWGGMEVGDGMMFAANVVDGLVHQLGGRQLQKVCQETLQSHPNGRLSEGQAIHTTAVGELTEQTPYNVIVHAVPPFYKQSNNTDITNNVTTEAVLAATYHNALNVAAVQGSPSSTSTDSNHRIRIATPLLGAGCRGFPVDVAMEMAAMALLEQPGPAIQESIDDVPMTLAFGIPNGEIRQKLIATFDRQQRPAIGMAQRQECR